MGLINGVNMEFINRVFKNLKAKDIKVVDTKGVTGTAGEVTNVQAMFDTLTLSGNGGNSSGGGTVVEEIAISSTEPTDPNVKMWVKEDNSNEGEEEEPDIIPFIKDNETSSDNTWSSSKIMSEIQSVREELSIVLSQLNSVVPPQPPEGL